jgi:hypothetical protein
MATRVVIRANDKGRECSNSTHSGSRNKADHDESEVMMPAYVHPVHVTGRFSDIEVEAAAS